MSCPFHKTNRIGPDCLREADRGSSFVYNTPTPSQVFDTALGCVGVPFRLGYTLSSGNSESDRVPCLQRSQQSWQRTKERTEHKGFDFSDAFRCTRTSKPTSPLPTSKPTSPLPTSKPTSPLPTSPSPTSLCLRDTYINQMQNPFRNRLTSLLDKQNFTHSLSERKKSKMTFPPNSAMSLKFAYHFTHPQRVNPMIDGIDIHQDTRMEQRLQPPRANTH
jgi:hypothetical protein